MGVEPYLLYFGLLTGATLGGNLTPIGASANITSIGLLRKEGYEVKGKDFMRIGVPFSLTAVISGYSPGLVRSGRIRPTSTRSWSELSSGMGYCPSARSSTSLQPGANWMARRAS